MTWWQRILHNNLTFSASLILVAIVGGSLLWWGRSPSAAPAAGAVPQTGFVAPDFSLDTLTGETITLLDLRGQVVVVNLWASWCPPCRAEMPALERVWNQYRERGLVVLAVNQQEPEATVAAFVSEYGLSFPVLLDREGTVGARYQLRAYPTTFFVGRDGIIGDMILGGPMSEVLIASTVAKLLEQ